MKYVHLSPGYLKAAVAVLEGRDQLERSLRNT